jgi:PDZ domain-containing protein
LGERVSVASRQDGDAAGRRYVLLLTSALSVIALSCVIGLMPIPYVSLQPGPAIDTLGEYSGEPMITFGKQAKTYPAKGRLDFTSVLVTRADRHFTLLDAVSAYLTPHTAIAPRRLIYQDKESSEESDKKLKAQLTSAKDVSQYVGLRAAGYDVDLQTTIASVAKGSPAAGVLRKDDVIIAVDGKKPKNVDAVVKAVSSRQPGSSVTLTVQRAKKTLELTVDTVANPDDPKKARVGVGLRPQLDYPFAIKNHIAKIGGPSAGAMFTLAIYDRLTPGSLTGGQHIAGTGTIEVDGGIGPIGSVRQKMAGASEAGASVFLVPSANCPEAVLDADRRGRVHGMRVVRVRTLDDAIAALRALAKDRHASVPGCGTRH